MGNTREDFTALPFYKKTLFEKCRTEKYAYHPYQVYFHFGGTLGTRTLSW